MESAAGPLRNAYPDRVLESKAPGVPLDSSVPGRGPRTQPQAPRGDRAGAPHPSPEPHPCPGSAFLPATPHPGEQRALGVRLGPASSALAAPGQPRDSARWMLCVAGAKLKVSGVWARSSASAGVGGWRGVCGFEGPRAARSSGLGRVPQRPCGTAIALSSKVCLKVNLAELC